MNRVCIFAHYDKDNIVDDYVLYYLETLKKSCSKIIFVSDSNLDELEKEKLSSIVDYIQAYNHGEYDWGSYKFGYKIAKEHYLFDSADELVFCNDSVYPIVNDLSFVFNKMSSTDCDFWGMYLNKFGLQRFVENPHLQSWFLVVKNKVLSSSVFDEFMLSIKKEDNKLDIINNYEIGFTKLLKTHFMCGCAYTSDYSDAVSNFPFKILKYGFPFVKTRALRKFLLDFYLEKRIDNKLHSAIKKHLKRSGCQNFFIKLFNTIKMFRKSRRCNISSNL